MSNRIKPVNPANQFTVLTFAEAKQPEYKEKKGEGGGYIEFGHRNDYPNYLVDLFNKSAKHNAIIKGKVNYITGNGFKPKQDADPVAEQFILQANQAESLNDILRKCSIDQELFGGFYLQIVWSQIGETIAEIYHLDYTKVRTNEDNTQFWYSENWKDTKYKRDVFNAFNSQVRSGTQILYIKEYRPNLNTYALPGYFGALNYIESDIEISKHVLGNAQTGFSASKLITLPNGEPTDDEKRAIERKFTDRFTGSDGKKFILSFVNDSSRKPVVEDLGASDITKEDFGNVDKMIQQNVFAGHQITAPDLFGISTPGQLGTRQQMRDSYEIFQNTYVNDKQLLLEQVFSLLTKLHGSQGGLEIIPVEPIGIEFSEATIASVAPKEWILEKLGIDITKYLQTQEIAQPEQAMESVTDRMQFSEDDILSMFENCGESKDDYSFFLSREAFGQAPSDLEETLNLEFAGEALTMLESNILDLISKDKRITPEVLAGTLKTDLTIINNVLAGLADKKLISVSSVKGTTERKLEQPLSSLQAPKPSVSEFMVRYSYEWRTGFNNTDLRTSREFCKRLIGLNRLYSRADIESISARLGYSVFDRRGGWWTKPDGVHSPSCRHVWKSQVVIRKNQ
jgi:hypothetical protein